MSSGHNKGSGLNRKKGEWELIAKGRSNKARTAVRMVNPLNCAPKIGEVGSAAYRRLKNK